MPELQENIQAYTALPICLYSRYMLRIPTYKMVYSPMKSYLHTLGYVQSGSAFPQENRLERKLM